MKKKNQGRTLLILALILAVCLVAYIALKQSNEKAELAESTSEEANEGALLAMEEDLDSLSYEQGGESISLIKDGDDWKAADVEGYPIDQSRAAEMARTVKNAVIKQVVAEEAEDLEAYGLKTPSCRLTVGSKGTQTTVLIGDENTVAEGCYCMIEGDSRVLLADAALATAYQYSLADLAAVDDGPDISGTAVQDITLQEGDRTMVLEYHAEGVEGVDATGNYTLFIKEDGGYRAIDADKQTDILNALSGISYEGLAVYEPTEEQLSAYGLTEPALTVTCRYTTEEEAETEADAGTEESGAAESESESETEPEKITVEHTYTLRVGSYDESTELYYVMHDDRNAVFTMAADGISALMGLNDAALTPMNPLDVPEDSVERIEVSFQGKSTVFALSRQPAAKDTETQAESGEAETTAADSETEAEMETVYTRDGQEMDADVFSQIYSALTGLAGARVLEEGEAVSGEAELTVTLHRNTAPDTVTVAFLPYNDDYYQAAVDGAAPSFVVNIRDVQKAEKLIFE